VALRDSHFSRWCHLAKNVYNRANYIVRQEFFASGRCIGHGELYHLVKNDDDYRALPSLVANEVLKTLHEAWRAFLASDRSYMRDPSRFLSRPRPPRYKDYDGEITIRFPRPHLSQRKGAVVLPSKVGRYRVRHALPLGTEVVMVRIVPRGATYEAEVVYREELDAPSAKGERIVGVDIGLENAMTVVDDQGGVPWIVKGGVLKSINQYYNKELARLRSAAAKSGQRTTKRMRRLALRRHRKLRDVLHRLSRMLVDHARRIGAHTIVVGYNEGWKQGVRLGRRTNQGFVQVPFHTLVHQIKYKAGEYGIAVVLQDESYTSKCSFLDGEPVERHAHYQGRRVNRGLFVAGDGSVVNADVNAAYNIIRKAFPNALAEGIEDASLHPVRMPLGTARECT